MVADLPAGRNSPWLCHLLSQIPFTRTTRAGWSSALPSCNQAARCMSHLRSSRAATHSQTVSLESVILLTPQQQNTRAVTSHFAETGVHCPPPSLNCPALSRTPHTINHHHQRHQSLWSGLGQPLVVVLRRGCNSRSHSMVLRCRGGGGGGGGRSTDALPWLHFSTGARNDSFRVGHTATDVVSHLLPVRFCSKALQQR